MKTILISGGAGYLGSVLSEMLLNQGYKIICLDRFFFGKKIVDTHCKNENYSIVHKDARHADINDFKGVDIVVDLAGISNDPSCEIDPNFTKCMNYDAPTHIAKVAKAAGVSRYIMASSCSVYGASVGEQLTENSKKNPVSLYAKFKIKCEDEIIKLASDNFSVIFLRLGTLFGASYRMRFDLIVNLMTMHALTKKRVIIMGGGKQWRPLLHVRDAANAFIKLIEAPAEIVNKEVFNVGSSEQNYQVIQVANIIKQEIPDTEIIIASDDPDKRNYNVSFDKIKKVLDYNTKYSVIDGVKEIKEAIMVGKIDTTDIRTSTKDYYKYLFEADKILEEIKINGKLY